jgi:hypothetical protein
MKKSSPRMIQKPIPGTPIAAELATVSATRIAETLNSTMLNRPNTLGLSASVPPGAAVWRWAAMAVVPFGGAVIVS